MYKSLDVKCDSLDKEIERLEDEYEEMFGEPSSSKQLEEMYAYVLANLSKENADTLDEYNRKWVI